VLSKEIGTLIGGVIGYSTSLIRAIRSSIAIYISISSTFIRISFISRVIYSIFSVFKVI